jgi:hypothetical protein
MLARLGAQSGGKRVAIEPFDVARFDVFTQRVGSRAGPARASSVAAKACALVRRRRV